MSDLEWGAPMIDDAITTTIALAARTLFVATSCVTALLGILLLFAWREREGHARERRSKWQIQW